MQVNQNYRHYQALTFGERKTKTPLKQKAVSSKTERGKHTWNDWFADTFCNLFSTGTYGFYKINRTKKKGPPKVEDGV